MIELILGKSEEIAENFRYLHGKDGARYSSYLRGALIEFKNSPTRSG